MKRFSPGDTVAWLMPIDVYEGIVVVQRADFVEMKPIIGPNDKVLEDSEFITADRLNLISRP